MKQTNISKLRSQAARYLRSQQAWGKSRSDTKRDDGTSAGIHSVRTWSENVTALAKIADDLGHTRLKKIDYNQALEYLINRVRSDLSDKTISRDRVALERLLARRFPTYQQLQKMKDDPKLVKKWIKTGLLMIKRTSKNQVPGKSGFGSKKTATTRPNQRGQRLKDISRAYTDAQIKEIAESFKLERERLSVLLMRDAGLRVHEMYTLRKPGEGKPISNQRDWVKERHLERDGVKYIVTGKGGLTREVMISKPLAERLEKLRLKKPQKVRDRKVVYRQRYNLLGGNNLSKRFSNASKVELGFSLGAHGARHSFAQARMAVLTASVSNHGLTAKQIKRIVSQEMGHMRPNITNTYLR